MKTIKYECENCSNKFAINYDEEVCESDPTFCPFCAEMMFLHDAIDDLEEEDSY